MRCDICNKLMTVKQESDFITIKCGCGCLIMYPDKSTRYVPVGEYKKNV